MKRTLIALMSAALLLAGCSGTDDATLQDAVDTDAVAETAADIAGAVDSQACQDAAAALQDVPAAVAGAATGQVDSQQIQDRADALRQAAADAPEEISADLDTVAATMEEVATTVAGLDLQIGEVPSQEAQDELSALSTTLSEEEFTTASANITAYLADGCQ